MYCCFSSHGSTTCCSHCFLVPQRDKSTSRSPKYRRWTGSVNLWSFRELIQRCSGSSEWMKLLKISVVPLLKSETERGGGVRLLCSRWAVSPSWGFEATVWSLHCLFVSYVPATHLLSLLILISPSLSSWSFLRCVSLNFYMKIYHLVEKKQYVIL